MLRASFGGSSNRAIAYWRASMALRKSACCPRASTASATPIARISWETAASRGRTRLHPSMCYGRETPSPSHPYAIGRCLLSNRSLSSVNEELMLQHLTFHHLGLALRNDEGARVFLERIGYEC